MAKFVGKFRQNRSYIDDEDYGRSFNKTKKRKKDEYREMRKMKQRSFEDGEYEYSDDAPKRMKLY